MFPRARVQVFHMNVAVITGIEKAQPRNQDPFNLRWYPQRQDQTTHVCIQYEFFRKDKYDKTIPGSAAPDFMLSV